MIMFAEDATVILEVGEDEEDVLNEARPAFTHPSLRLLLLELD